MKNVNPRGWLMPGQKPAKGQTEWLVVDDGWGQYGPFGVRHLALDPTDRRHANAGEYLYTQCGRLMAAGRSNDLDDVSCGQCIRTKRYKALALLAVSARPIRTGDEDQEGDENGSFCWNSRLWLALRAFTRPSGCPNQKQYEESACRGCGYFEIRELTPYVRKRLALFGEAFAGREEVAE